MLGQHISLFSGVGMLDLAAEEAGFKTIATAEVLPLCNSVLDIRFPGTLRYKDVKDVSVLDDTLRHAAAGGGPLLITGGSPCQGFSDSGYRGGLQDPRSGLLLEMLRIVGEFQPEYVLVENSPLLLKRGGEKVIQRLTHLGYYVRWECIPAAYVGAPHMRDRVWIMARRAPFRTVTALGKIGSMPRSGVAGPRWALETAPLTTRREARGDHRLMPTPTKSDGTGGPGVTPKRTGGMNLRTFASLREGNGRLNPKYVEWMMGLPHGWTDPQVDNDALVPHDGWLWTQHSGLSSPRFYVVEPKDPFFKPIPMTVHSRDKLRSQRIQALGNGLVPQVARIALDLLING